MRGRRTKKIPAAASDEMRRSYRPPAWAWRLVRAFLDPDVKPTIQARCDDAGVHKMTFYRHLRKPEFVTWFKGLLQEGLLSEMSDVRQAHLRLCLEGDLEAIRLWYERYGEFVPTSRHIIDGDLSELSDGALEQIERILAAGGAQGKGPTVH